MIGAIQTVPNVNAPVSAMLQPRNTEFIALLLEAEEPVTQKGAVLKDTEATRQAETAIPVPGEGDNDIEAEVKESLQPQHDKNDIPPALSWIPSVDTTTPSATPGSKSIAVEGGSIAGGGCVFEQPHCFPDCLTESPTLDATDGATYREWPQPSLNATAATPSQSDNMSATPSSEKQKSDASETASSPGLGNRISTMNAGDSEGGSQSATAVDGPVPSAWRGGVTDVSVWTEMKDVVENHGSTPGVTTQSTAEQERVRNVSGGDFLIDAQVTRMPELNSQGNLSLPVAGAGDAENDGNTRMLPPEQSGGTRSSGPNRPGGEPCVDAKSDLENASSGQRKSQVNGSANVTPTNGVRASGEPNVVTGPVGNGDQSTFGQNNSGAQMETRLPTVGQNERSALGMTRNQSSPSDSTQTGDHNNRLVRSKESGLAGGPQEKCDTLRTAKPQDGDNMAVNRDGNAIVNIPRHDRGTSHVEIPTNGSSSHVQQTEAAQSAETTNGQGSHLPEVPDPSPQVAKTAALQSAQSGRSEMRIGLNTAEAGRVEVHAVVHDGRIGASISVDRPDVQQALIAELPNLEKTLNARDLDVVAVAVSQSHFAPGADAGFAGNADQQYRPWKQLQNTCTGSCEQSAETPSDEVGSVRNGLSVHA